MNLVHRYPAVADRRRAWPRAACAAVSLFARRARRRAREFLLLLPRIAIGMIGSGFIAECCRRHLIAAWFGAGTGLHGLVSRRSAARSPRAGRWSAFPSGRRAEERGRRAAGDRLHDCLGAVRDPAVLIYEIPSMPPRIVWLRVAVSLPLPFLAAWAPSLMLRRNTVEAFHSPSRKLRARQWGAVPDRKAGALARERFCPPYGIGPQATALNNIAPRCSARHDRAAMADRPRRKAGACARPAARGFRR